MTTRELIHAYYAAFNARDMETFLNLLAENAVHDINQGERQIGKAAFARFMGQMNTNYSEVLEDIVIMQSDDGRRAAAEFVVRGEYLAADDGLPEAHGQSYVLPAGAFFEVEGDKISRVTNYYNLQDWLRQVGA
jgi:steroid delta-isomerase-like uncharacterized protein